MKKLIVRVKAIAHYEQVFVKDVEQGRGGFKNGKVVIITLEDLWK